MTTLASRQVGGRPLYLPPVELLAFDSAELEFALFKFAFRSLRRSTVLH